MNERIRELFESEVFLNFVSGKHGLTRKDNGQYESDLLEDHWNTFQEGFELAIKECGFYLLENGKVDTMDVIDMEQHFGIK